LDDVVLECHNCSRAIFWWVAVKKIKVLIKTHGVVKVMHDQGKRSFFRDLFKETVIKPIAAFQSGMQEVDTDNSLDEFFESYESSYALTLNYPDDILIETARMEGISVEGREKIDIVRELIKKKGGYFDKR